MHCPAHERQTHQLPVDERPPERAPVEPLEPRPETVVGRAGRLRLKPEQTLDQFGECERRAPEQMLAGKKRPVAGAQVEQPGSAAGPPLPPRRGRPPRTHG